MLSWLLIRVSLDDFCLDVAQRYSAIVSYLQSFSPLSLIAYFLVLSLYSRDLCIPSQGFPPYPLTSKLIRAEPCQTSRQLPLIEGVTVSYDFAANFVNTAAATAVAMRQSWRTRRAAMSTQPSSATAISTVARR
jgi:hypothetical protein